MLYVLCIGVWNEIFWVYVWDGIKEFSNNPHDENVNPFAGFKSENLHPKSRLNALKRADTTCHNIFTFFMKKQVKMNLNYNKDNEIATNDRVGLYLIAGFPY